MKYICPVCGYDHLYEPAYDEEGGGGSYEFCPSCGFQFGVSDDAYHITHNEWRQQWIENGMQWDDTGPGGRENERPPNWNPAIQLLKIGVQVE